MDKSKQINSAMRNAQVNSQVRNRMTGALGIKNPSSPFGSTQSRMAGALGIKNPSSPFTPVAPRAPAPAPAPNYGNYNQRFDSNVAKDFNNWYNSTQGMDPTQRALAFNKHMQAALGQGRFSAQAAKQYQDLVGAYQRGEVSAEDALKQVNSYINRHATEGAGAKKAKADIGKPAEQRQVTARLFSKGGAVDKKAKPKTRSATPTRAKPAAKKAASRRAAPKKAAGRVLTRSPVRASRRPMPKV